MRRIIVFSFATLCAAGVLGQDESGPARNGRTFMIPRSPWGTRAPTSVGVLTTIHSNLAGHPSAQVPGLPGVEFTPSTGTTTFERPFGSPNGNWVIDTDVNTTTADDDVLLSSFGIVAREGDPAPFDLGFTIGTIDVKCGINDSGTVAYANNTSNTVNDDFIVSVTYPGGVYTIHAQEGGPILGLPGATYDDNMDGPLITAAGGVGFEADLIDGRPVTTTTDDIVEINGTVVVQSGVTVPGNQAGGAVYTVQTIDFEEYYTDPTGANWMIQGDSDNPNTNEDDFLIVNGSYVLQEGYPVPGSAFVDPIDASGIVLGTMDFGGNWSARGNNDVTEQDWVVRNGVVVANVGDSVTPGAAEKWDDVAYSDCFFAHTGNALGDYVVCGVTDNADLNANGLIVRNGSQVILREGDPIDLDNNGLFDDGVFFNTFGNDDFVLWDSCDLVFTATFRDAALTVLGQGLFRLALNDCGCGYISSIGTGCAGTGGLTPRFDVNGCAKSGGVVNFAVRDGLPSSLAIMFIGVTQVALPMDGGCVLYLNPLPTIIGLPLDANGEIAFPALIPAIASGFTVYTQAFVQDLGVPQGFSNTNGIKLEIK
ncbi:MAG: hypothetical protein HY812_16990 [Planctomycetes bacterium]|nr:hypothetical protein [Planctomycetota bacterium]